jgi:hypothetical protein
MKNSQFLEYYQHLQYGIMYKKLIDLGFASVAWCEKDKSAFWNYAGVDNLLDDNEIKVVERTLKVLKRNPAIYFENRKELSSLVRKLKRKGYKKFAEDSWMFHNGKNVDDSRFGAVKKVKTEKDLEEFLETFDACYQKDDPQNPYGELNDYLDVTRDAWYQHRGSDRLEYFVVYKGKNAVAVSTLTNFAKIGYISNVGSLREVRGEGFGKVASLYAVVKSKKNGNTEHALATEEGDYPNEFYKRIGFRTRFTAVGYVKKDREWK